MSRNFERTNSNPLPPAGLRRPPPPPPPPPVRTVGFFGETPESIRARREYEIYMQGWQQGFAAASPPPVDK